MSALRCAERHAWRTPQALGLERTKPGRVLTFQSTLHFSARSRRMECAGAMGAHCRRPRRRCWGIGGSHRPAVAAKGFSFCSEPGLKRELRSLQASATKDCHIRLKRMVKHRHNPIPSMSSRSQRQKKVEAEAGHLLRSPSGRLFCLAA